MTTVTVTRMIPLIRSTIIKGKNTGTGAPPNDVPVLQKITVLSTQDCGIFLHIFKIDSSDIILL